MQSKQVLLIADANPENVNILKAMLASNYDIKVAADGEEAIGLASSPNAPGLILPNNMVPTADIVEVCRKLKADRTTKEIPIIFLQTDLQLMSNLMFVLCHMEDHSPPWYLFVI